jgi:hypothetical protein
MSEMLKVLKDLWDYSSKVDVAALAVIIVASLLDYSSITGVVALGTFVYHIYLAYNNVSKSGN